MTTKEWLIYVSTLIKEALPFLENGKLTIDEALKIESLPEEEQRDYLKSKGLI